MTREPGPAGNRREGGPRPRDTAIVDWTAEDRDGAQLDSAIRSSTTAEDLRWENPPWPRQDVVAVKINVSHTRIIVYCLRI